MSSDQHNEEGDAERKLPVQIVTLLLDAMKRGSIEARQRFPRLLQLISADAGTTSPCHPHLTLDSGW